MEKGLQAMAGGNQFIAAYDINGWQPVECTIIGKDPLYYSNPLQTLYDPPPIEGWAWCETCQGIRPFHSEIDEEPACAEEHRMVTELICNCCDMQIARFFSPMPKDDE